MEITRLDDLQAGSHLILTASKMNLSDATIEEILSPLLRQAKAKSKEQHYRTVLLLTDMLEQSETEEDFLDKLREHFSDFVKE